MPWPLSTIYRHSPLRPGHTFNEFVLIEKILRGWLCRCSCGSLVRIKTDEVNNQSRRSCIKCQSKFYPRASGNRSAAWKGFEDIPAGFWRHVRLDAEVRNLSFDLSIQEAWKIFQDQGGRCCFTGLELSFSAKNRTASLDRKDREDGYRLGNVQWVAKPINRIKWVLTDSDFIGICRQVAKPLPKENRKYQFPKRKGKGNWQGYCDLSKEYLTEVKRFSNHGYRRIEFHLSMKEAWDQFIIQCGQCAVTGQRLRLGPRKEMTGSLDRVDSNGPYKMGNVQWVCKPINMMKANFSMLDFKAYCEMVAEYADQLKLKQSAN